MYAPYNVKGIWWCRPCCENRLFISYDLRLQDPDLFECISCGFQWGKSIDPTGVNPSQRVKRVLSEAVVKRGYERFLAQEVRRRNQAGLPMQVPNEIRQEIARRRGLD